MVRMRSTNPCRYVLVVVLMFVILVINCGVTSGTEIKYTPNDGKGDSDAGPLPLSQNQRNQLVKLEQAVAQSPDPQATLQQVAQANNMDPQELLSLLQRNRQDIQQAGGGAPGPNGQALPTWPQALLKLFTSIGVLISRTASKHPKRFFFVLSAILIIAHTIIMAPRNGIIMSERDGLFSKGHTTFFQPPTPYIDRYLQSPRLARATVSIPKNALQSITNLSSPSNQNKQNTFITTTIHKQDGVIDHKQNQKNTNNKDLKQLARALTAQLTIPLQDFIPEEMDHDDEFQQEVSALLLETAAGVLLNRRFSEFMDGSLRIQSSSSEQRRSVLVLPRAGDYGRHGVQPLKLVQQSEDDARVGMEYNTLKGGVFDGQLQFTMHQQPNGDVVVKANIFIPKRGRKLSKKLATQLITSTSDSIVRSIRTETNQKIARQMQGARYKSKAKSRASERRAFRFEKEKELEDMAEDRRRRRQRQNPNSGSYRPSNRRQQSPNNC